MDDYFVCPDGDDTGPGTERAPFATVERARRAAATSRRAVVHLRGGTHVLTEPLRLTAADSGTTYRAAGYGTERQERPVLSGGRAISGWRVRDGVWLAAVGDLDTRQLYVDGARVERAGIDGLDQDARTTATGYTTTDTGPAGWRSPSSVEFVYRGVYPWTEARCGVSEVGRDGAATTIAMRRPAFSLALELYNFAWAGVSGTGPGMPSRIENDPSFLVEPGTFALDRSLPGRHVLHYLPRPGEHVDRTRVVAPALERLLSIAGADDLAFEGLAFTDATWTGPHRDGGLAHYHGTNYYTGGGVERVAIDEGQWVTVPAPDTTATIPACVAVDDGRRIRFDRCEFSRLGATALSATGGAEVTVRGCDFHTVAATAVEVGGVRSALVEDNAVTRVGLDYAGAPGIAVADTVDCVVAHNLVTEVPHCGIVAGPARGTRLLRNRTEGTMSALADGGGIYLSGPQGDATNGAVIGGNVVKDTRTPYNFGLYTDYGAAWVTVEDNVVAGGDNSAVLHVHPPLEHVVYRRNRWDADPVGVDAVPPGVTYEDNTTIADEAALDRATAPTQRRAGLLRERQVAGAGIRERPDDRVGTRGR